MSTGRFKRERKDGREQERRANSVVIYFHSHLIRGVIRDGYPSIVMMTIG